MSGTWRSLSAVAVAVFIAVSAAASEPPPAPAPRLLVVNDGNAVDTLDAWRAIVCEEFAVLPGADSTDSTTARPVGPRVAISALGASGAVVPLDDLSYIFPRAGLYVLRNGHVIQAHPLALSALDRIHRMLDLDRRGVILRRANEMDGGSVPVPAHTSLRVGAECRAVRLVLGQSLEELLLRPLSDAELVVFEPTALSRALSDLNRVRAGAPLVNRPAAESGVPGAKSRRGRNRI